MSKPQTSTSAAPDAESLIQSPVARGVLLVASGMAFGAALQRGRVHEAATVVAQMTFSRFIMLKMFLSALATSTLVFYFVERRMGRATTRYQFHQAFKLYWWQVALGASLLGIGMTLSGSCPGTVYAQIGAGSSKAWYTFAGGLVGALIFSFIEKYRAEIPSARPQSSTLLASLLNIDPQTFPVKLALSLYAFIAVLEIFVPWKTDLQGLENYPNWLVANPPIVSGIMIGLIQFPLQVLLGYHLGSSSSFSCVLSNSVPLGHYCGRTAFSREGSRFQVLIMFGIVLGSFVASSLSGTMYASDGLLSSSRHFLGGVLAVFGALFSGGCTSGHGLSGLGQQSALSALAVACMFGSAIATGVGLSVYQG